MKKIFTIEEVVQPKKKGVLLFPMIPLSEFEGKILPNEIELRFIDGKIEKRNVEMTIPRQSPESKELSYLFYLKSGMKDKIPVGTEVWANIIDKN